MANSKRTAGLATLAVAMLVCAVWFSVRHSAATISSEPRLDLPLICAECGSNLRVDFDGLLKLTNDARAKGAAAVDGDPRSPVGFCAKCGKAALYRADEDPQTGRPVLPAFARRPQGKSHPSESQAAR